MNVSLERYTIEYINDQYVVSRIDTISGNEFQVEITKTTTMSSAERLVEDLAGDLTQRFPPSTSYDELVDVSYEDLNLYSFIVRTGKPPETLGKQELLEIINTYYSVTKKV